MSSVEIRDVIREYQHHIFHLERSQGELKAALEEDPEDRDFMFAYLENQETIALKKESIKKLEEKLEEVDPAHCQEELAAVRNLSLSVKESGEKETDNHVRQSIATSHSGPQIAPDDEEGDEGQGVYL
eukprot:gene9944-10994_t